MLKRDFIMIQIEELAKVVLQIIMNRNTNAARHTPEYLSIILFSSGTATADSNLISCTAL